MLTFQTINIILLSSLKLHKILKLYEIVMNDSKGKITELLFIMNRKQSSPEYS